MITMSGFVAQGAGQAGIAVLRYDGELNAPRHTLPLAILACHA